VHKDAVGVAIAAAIAGLGTLSVPLLRPASLSPAGYVLGLAITVFFCSVVLKAPQPAVMLLSPIGLWIGEWAIHQNSSAAVEYGHRLAFFAFALMVWTVTELLLHRLRLNLDASYRKRWYHRND